jgi:hypothetical protein
MCAERFARENWPPARKAARDWRRVRCKPLRLDVALCRAERGVTASKDHGRAPRSTWYALCFVTTA